MYNVVELFSGIGSQAKAMRNLGLGKTIATCEWDVHAILAYDLIHNNSEISDQILNMTKEQILGKIKGLTFSNSGKEPLDYESLRTYSLQSLQRLFHSILCNHNSVDINALIGKNMPGDIDILTYSFPCQDLSNVGAFHGYNKGIDKDSGSRSSLLWQVGRILEEMKEAGKHLPRFLLMENVPSLLFERHFPNFSIWINDLKKLGYLSKYYQLNASSFGLPQNRPRLLMISVLVDNNPNLTELILDYFRVKSEEEVIQDYKSSKYYRQYTVQELLRTNYKNAELFEEACECTPNDTVSRRKIWEENPKIVKEGYVFNESMETIRTITTKQDRNPNSGNLYFESGIEGRSTFRYLTPRECMLFMGFTDEDYQRLKDNNLEFHKGDAFFARDKVIRMAGNSIPVKLLEGMFYQIWQIDKLIEDYHLFCGDEQTRENLHKERLREVKSFLFAEGIRSRKPNREYPEDADLVYPKYNTVLYVRDCFTHGHSCTDSRLPKVNHALWEERLKVAKAKDESAYKRAQEMGWNVIVFWSCALHRTEETHELVLALKRNQGEKAYIGEVVEIG